MYHDVLSLFCCFHKELKRKLCSLQAVRPGATIFVGQYLFTGSETTSVWLEVKKCFWHADVPMSNAFCCFKCLSRGFSLLSVFSDTKTLICLVVGF
jgi:hypothetical protein